MVEEAIRKIEEEIKKENHPYVNEVGTFLLSYLENNPGAAEKILNENKTIVGSLKMMETIAKKKRRSGDNCVLLAPEEGFKIVTGYFEIESKPEELRKDYKPKDYVEIKTEEVKKEENNDIGFDINLDDYI